jgi:hypothetical protein
MVSRPERSMPAKTSTPAEWPENFAVLRSSKFKAFTAAYKAAVTAAKVQAKALQNKNLLPMILYGRSSWKAPNRRM